MAGGMRGELEVLEANARFYETFTRRDAAAMERIWAERLPVTCVHPGWDVLVGHERVLGSWRGILGSPGAPRISCSHAEACLLGDVALVTCQEVLAEGLLAATNVFAREGGAWRMIHHQASPIAPGQERPVPKEGLAN